MPTVAHRRIEVDGVNVFHAELHLLRGGHWALETNLDEIVAKMRDFLGRAMDADQ